MSTYYEATRKRLDFSASKTDLLGSRSRASKVTEAQRRRRSCWRTLISHAAAFTVTHSTPCLYIDIDIQERGSPSKALSMLIRCVDLAEKYNVRLIYLGAVRLLAKVLNEFEQFQEAFRILSSVMPYVRSLSNEC